MGDREALWPRSQFLQYSSVDIRLLAAAIRGSVEARPGHPADVPNPLYDITRGL
jgi:hypothetical protein